MKIKINRLLSLIMTLVFVLISPAASAYAALPEEDPSIEPMYNNVYTPQVTFDYINGKISASVRIQGLSGTTFSDGTVKIQRKYGLIYIAIEEWSNLSASGTFYFFDDSITPAEGEQYRIKYSVKATRNGSSETVSDATSPKTYNP